MRIIQRLSSEKPSFSFEFFAPKTDLGRERLTHVLDELTELSPGFISVTCGASGSSRQPSLDLMKDLASDRRFLTMAHLTCMGVSESTLRNNLDFLRGLGLENILALRGDPPAEEVNACREKSGPGSAADFVQMIQTGGWNFCIGGAAYPETHPRAASSEADLSELKRKVDAGAEFLITQLFFDNALFYDFVRRARAVGIAVPIIPGIMPITDAGQVERFRTQCGVALPEKIAENLARIRGNAEAVQEFGTAYATAQCIDLIAHGFRHIHFFTLNKSPATRAIVTAIRCFAS